MKITLNEQKIPRDGFGKDHLLSRISLGKVYTVLDSFQASVQVMDDRKRGLWLSGSKLKRYFKEAV